MRGGRGRDYAVESEVEDVATAEAVADRAEGGDALGFERGDDLVERRAGFVGAVIDEPLSDVELFLRTGSVACLITRSELAHPWAHGICRDGVTIQVIREDGLGGISARHGRSMAPTLNPFCAKPSTKSWSPVSITRGYRERRRTWLLTKVRPNTSVRRSRTLSLG